MALSSSREYSIIKNLQDTPAEITFGQLLQASPLLQRELSQGLRKVPKQQLVEEDDNDTIDVEPIVRVNQTTSTQQNATPMKVKASIKGYKTDLILDSGSAVSIVSKAFLAQIGEKAIAPSSMIISLANGELVRPLGKVNLQITVGIITIPMAAHIIETTDYTLLAGNEWLRKSGALINWQHATVSFNYGGKTMTTGVDYGSTGPEKTIRFKPEYADETLPINRVFVNQIYTSWANQVEDECTFETISYKKTKRNRQRRVPNVCYICKVRKSTMSLQLSPHEEWGKHTVLYCSACHRETFEAWHKEQEENRTGKWTGTECLVCQEVLERVDWFDEPDQGGTCALECHMVWQIYKKVLRC